MKKTLPVLIVCAVIFMGMLYANRADAAIINFNINGTYSAGLNYPDSNTAIFSAGDSFNISGSYDTTGQQPSVETKANGMVVLQDQGMLPFFYTDYSSLTTLTSNIPLATINTYYPSTGGTINAGFNDGDTKTGSYFTDSVMNLFGASISSSSLDMFSNYTHLSLSLQNIDQGQGNQIMLSGSLTYNYHEKIEQYGEGQDAYYIYYWVNDTINLNVDSFQTTEVPSAVPLPASILLLGTGLAGLIGTRIKRIIR
jgi:hypothetical protein